MDFGKETAMILDIGGGSNEFIICNAEGILWKRSFELGMARIIERFNISDPITQNEIQMLEAYYLQELGLLLEHAEKYNPSLLVGASGTFDTLAAMAENRYGIRSSDHSSVKIKLEHFLEMHQSLLESTTEERLAMAGMEPVRVEMIVPASIFIKFVYDNCKLTSITQSRNALKEGVMATLVSKR